MVISLAWKGMENRMGLHGPRIDEQARYTYIFGGVALLLYILALRDKRDNFYNGFMSWQQGFVSGVIISVIIALFSPLSQLIVHKIIAPSYFRNAIEHGLTRGGNEEFLISYYSLRTKIIQSFMESLSLGIVASAAVAYFVRKR